MPPEGRVCPRCGALQPLRETLSQGTAIDLGYAQVVPDARIGEGGMGVVWRGWLFFPPSDPRGSGPPEPVALKVLHPHIARDARGAFRNEAEALRHLSHPNIVRFYDLFERGETLVLMIEYVDGDTIERVIARHVARARVGQPAGIPFQRAWYYFQQLLGALAATHALGIVHADIKPANVLIRRDGIVKLTDFGIARFDTRAVTGIDAGTSLYMSPEQVQGLALDGRSDLYSAATVFYEMLSGHAPFAGDKGEFVIRRDQVETPPPSIRTWIPQASLNLDALFRRALAKNPRQRFSSAIDLGEAFRESLGLPKTPEWRAQADVAQVVAAPGRQGTLELATERRLATLREFLVKGYRTEPLAAQEPRRS